jgi:hypothetical protein
MSNPFQDMNGESLEFLMRLMEVVGFWVIGSKLHIKRFGILKGFMHPVDTFLEFDLRVWHIQV